MKFETKFNIGDHVWYMKDNKPIEVVISSIDIFEVGTNQNHIKYTARNTIHSVSWLDHQHLFEASLFRTKEGLLQSLFSDDKLCKGKDCKAVNGVGHSAECIQEHNQACEV